MKKVIIIKSSQESVWGSCKVISPNLYAAYEALAEAGEVELKTYAYFSEVFVDNLLNGSDNIAELAELITNWKPDILAFVDHVPHPEWVLKQLTHLLALKKIPPVLVHVYGDFSFFSDDWWRFGIKFKGHPVKLVVASAAQKRLVSFFLEESQAPSEVGQYLFPVNDSQYFFDPKAREEFRAEQEIAPEERVILYAGRISLQKNVDLLVREFRSLAQSSTVPLRLWIVGAFDDVGAIFMGAKNYEGFMYAKIQKILAGFPPDLRSKVTLWGQQDSLTLRRLKSAADVFVSLSLYHDEDFGMSPAEALACGLPSVLTDWGGYGSFPGKGWDCRLVPVEISEFGHKINLRKLRDDITEIISSETTDEQRLSFSKAFAAEFSIRSSSTKLREILSQPFSPLPGFKWNLNYLSTIFWKEQRRSKYYFEFIGREVNANFHPTSNSFYYDIYRNYITGPLDLGKNNGKE